jgi:hypothetical protein
MKRFLNVLFFLLLTAEAPSAYGGYWQLPFSLSYGLLFDWKPLAAPFIDIFALIVVIGSARFAIRPDPIGRTLLLSTATLTAWSAYGILTGGSAYQIQFQIHTLVASFLFAVACRRALQTPQDYFTFGKTMIYAALYRALMCVAFYVFVLRENVLNPPPQFCTSHDDTVLFVTALVALWLHLGFFPSPLQRKRVLYASALILVGIVLNNRRLAWVSLLSAILLIVAVLTSSSRQLIRRISLRVLPLVALYALIGWGRPEAVFAPLRSLSSVTSSEDDASTRSRDAENAGLIHTLRANPVFGSGWGHEYIEIDDTLSAREFTQYRFVPHNSLLALLAFSGFLGFYGVWLIWPVCGYLAARAVRHARDPEVRCFGMVILVTLVVVLNQVWGDMGLFSYTTTFIMAAACSCASHLHAFEAQVLTQPVTASEPAARYAAFG